MRRRRKEGGGGGGGRGSRGPSEGSAGLRGVRGYPRVSKGLPGGRFGSSRFGLGVRAGLASPVRFDAAGPVPTGSVWGPVRAVRFVRPPVPGYQFGSDPSCLPGGQDDVPACPQERDDILSRIGDVDYEE